MGRQWMDCIRCMWLGNVSTAVLNLRTFASCRAWYTPPERPGLWIQLRRSWKLCNVQHSISKQSRRLGRVSEGRAQKDNGGLVLMTASTSLCPR